MEELGASGGRERVETLLERELEFVGINDSNGYALLPSPAYPACLSAYIREHFAHARVLCLEPSNS